MGSIDRRTFLRRAGGALLAPSLAGLAACGRGGVGGGTGAGSGLSVNSASGLPQAALGVGGYGPLSVSPDVPELLVPSGFRVMRVSSTRQPSRADPSFIVPNAVDGMAAFSGPNGTVRLVRNHEINDRAGVARPFGSENVYDARGGGGTVTVELRVRGSGAGRTIEVVREFPSLNGTHVNCAGGPTPWGSWLSCEETTAERDRPHGYIFEVPSLWDRAVEPVPLVAMGRFVHEAIAVDPVTGIVYETEDRRYEPGNDLPGAGFYRFIPERPGSLRAGGRLQMLAIAGQPQYLTARGQTPGLPLPVEWVDIDDPDPVNAADDPSALFREGLSKGGALFHRLEGCWFGDDTVYFNATEGGDAGAGQVWQYRPDRSADPTSREGGELTLVFESPGAHVLDSPDNLCVSPRGGLVLCEDTDNVPHIRGLTREGTVFDLVQMNGIATEFAGSCFSPDGEILFFNIQGSIGAAGTDPGHTYAMWGPWEDGVL